MSQDRSGRYTLVYIVFGFVFSLVLIFGTGFYAIAKKVGQAPPVPAGPGFPLSAADFEPFTKEAPASASAPVTKREGGARLDRPLRLGAPVRGSLVPAALIQARDASRDPKSAIPAGSVEWKRMDARLERYEALARGEVDLIWDTLGSLAEELPRLQALGLQARVVMPLGSGDLGDALVMARKPGPVPARGSFAAVEAFSAAHLITLELLTTANLSEGEKAARQASIVLVGSPAEAHAKAIWEEGGSAVSVGTGSALTPEGHRETGSAPFLNVEVLVAHPALLKDAPGSLTAMLERWIETRDASQGLPEALHPDVARVFGIDVAEVPRIGGPSGMPDAAAQQRFFRGVGAAWTDAAATIWTRSGLLRKASPAGPWFDGSYVPASPQPTAEK